MKVPHVQVLRVESSQDEFLATVSHDCAAADRDSGLGKMLRCIHRKRYGPTRHRDHYAHAKAQAQIIDDILMSQ